MPSHQGEGSYWGSLEGCGASSNICRNWESTGGLLHSKKYVQQSRVGVLREGGLFFWGGGLFAWTSGRVLVSID